MRIDFDALPASVRVAVEARTGTVRAALTASGGINSHIDTFLETDTGRVFLKGLPEDHAGIRGQQREADVNPHLCGTGPRLLWTAVFDGWSLLACEVVEDARTIDYSPGSPDLPKLAALFGELAKIERPPVAIMAAERRWAGCLDDAEDSKHFAGDGLLRRAADNDRAGEWRRPLVEAARRWAVYRNGHE